jgi:ribonuclease HII
MKATKNSIHKPTFKEEQILWDKGFDYVIGADEVGRGSFAGPIVAAAVVFKKSITEKKLRGVNDSKLLSAIKRRELSKVIISESLFWAIRSVSVSIINKVGIGNANKMALRKAIGSVMKKTKNNKVFVLVDGFHVKHVKGVGISNEKAIIKGDRKSLTIAAASIIAKVHRDKIMRCLSKKYPKYGLEQNMGYGTKRHRLALKEYGLCGIHRTSFNLSKFL